MQLYLSLSAYGGVTTREALATFWEADIRHVELAIGPRRESDATLAIRDFQQQGMVYRAHHAFVWGTDHSSFNLAGRFDSDYFVSLVDWLAKSEITAYSVHAGSYPTAGSKVDAYERFLDNIHRLNELCKKRGVTLGVETMYAMPPYHPSQNLLDNAHDIERFCYEAPEIKLVIDLAHLNIWPHNHIEEKLQLLKLPPQRLLEIHVSDNDGKRDIHSRITPHTWWIPWAELIPSGIPLVLESRMNRLNVKQINREYHRVRELLARVVT